MNEIRNLDRFRQSKMIDFDGLRGVFPLPTIRPTDLDFIVERRGRFLIGEVKYAGASVPLGQQILLDALLKQLPDCWLFEAEHVCKDGELIRIAYASVLRCRSLHVEKTFNPGQMTVLHLCQLWTATFVSGQTLGDIEQ